jgi:hypothetical protein
MALSNGGVAEKPVKISKTERYTFNLSAWLNGEAIATATVTGDAKATLSAADINGGIIGWFATGVAKGVSVVHIEYTTATRSDCQNLRIIVIDDC